MPIVLRRGQYRFGFYASDQNERPHVHVRKNGHQAKFWLVPVIDLEKNEGLRPHELNEAERIIIEEREFLLEEWNGFFGRGH